MTVTLTALDPAQIAALHPRIVEIYDAAFTRPPYNKPAEEIRAFADALLSQTSREGYRFVAAFDDDDRQMAGFAYGYATAAGRWWLEHVNPAMPEETARAWLDGSYSFVELAVDPSCQGKGVGGLLHEALLDGLPYERAVLSTLQAETVASRLYRSRGWVVLLEDFFFPGIPRRYQIMGLDLAHRRAQS